MATIDVYGDNREQRAGTTTPGTYLSHPPDTRLAETPGTTTPGTTPPETTTPDTTPGGGTSGAGGGTDWSDVERRLREAGRHLYDPSDLESVRRNFLNTGPGYGRTIAQLIEDARRIYELRERPTSHRPRDSQDLSAEAQRLNTAADRAAGFTFPTTPTTPPATTTATSMLFTGRPQTMPDVPTGGIYGWRYQQAYTTIQKAAKQYLGGYLEPGEINLHLRNMGWRADRDPDENILRSALAWAPTLARSPEAVDYAARVAAAQQPAAAAAQAPSGPSSGGGGTTGGTTTTAPPPTAFNDPIGGPVNAYANERFTQLNTPAPGSGINLLEDALRRIAQQLQAGGYLPAELELFQTQALDPLERLRTARRQQVLQQLSQRGIRVNLASPEGVAKQMLDDVDRQFDALRAQQQTQLGVNAANQRVGRMMTGIQLFDQLAGSEEGRRNQAFQYRTVPVGLADRAFSQALQLYGQANPLNLFNPAMQLTNLGMNQQAQFGAALAALADLLLQGRRA